MKKYGCILADPPWGYFSGYFESGNGAQAAHYAGMTQEQIEAIPVASWAADDAFLCLWGTWPKLTEAPAVMEAWGFEYVTGFPWIKTQKCGKQPQNSGIGYWTMGISEFLLIGRRGKAVRRDSNNSRTPMGLLMGDPAIFWSDGRRKHSQKPEGIQDWLQRVCYGPYLELFARRQRPGWDCWGNELGFILSAEGVRREPIPEPTAGPLFDDAIY